jgi:hypothetical protein
MHWMYAINTQGHCDRFEADEWVRADIKVNRIRERAEVQCFQRCAVIEVL